MVTKLKTPIEKECEKCKTKFTTDNSTRRFCSTACGKSREWTKQQNESRSNKVRQWKQTDEGEDNSFNILKNKKIPPRIPGPDEPRLQEGQFVDGDELWNVDDRDIDWERYYGWK